MPDFEIFKGNTKEILKMFKPKHTLTIFVILLAIVIGIFCASILMFYNNQQKSNTIQSGVYIKGINVSGLTKDEAIALIENELRDKMESPLELTYKNNKYYLEIEQIGAKFDINASVEYALSIAKSGDFFKDLQEYISTLLTNINIEPNLNYNEESLTMYLENIEANLPDQLEEPSYYIEDGELIITNGIDGVGIEMDSLKKMIIDSIYDLSFASSYMKIPTYIKKPDPINVEKIHGEVFKQAENAYFTTEPYAVFADVVGVDFDSEKVKGMIEEDPYAEEYTIDLIYTRADVTVNDLGAEACPDLLASFSTKYATSNKDRTTNLRLAAEKINGTVVMPGEIFSYNTVVGKRTIAAGYKEADIYENGQVTSGLGGGICQISTTLYNAAIAANMEIESRRNHMFVPSYADPRKRCNSSMGVYRL